MKKNLCLLLAIIMLISTLHIIANAENFNTGVHQIFMDFENGVSHIYANGTASTGGNFIDSIIDSSALSDANGNYVYNLPVTSSTSTISGGYIDLETVFGTGNVFNPGEKLIVECDYYNHGNSSVNGFGFSFPQTNTDGSVKAADMRRPLLWWTKENSGKRYFVCKGADWDTTFGLDTQPSWYTVKTEIYYGSDANDSSWEIISFKKQGESNYTSLPKIVLDGSLDNFNNLLDYNKGFQKYLGIFGTSSEVKNYIDNLKITLVEKELYESIQTATDKNDIKCIIEDFSQLEGFEYLNDYSLLHSAYKNYIAQNLYDNRALLTDNELVKVAYLDYADDDIDLTDSYTLNIKGSSKLLKPLDNNTISVIYKAYDNDNNEITDVEWECTNAEFLDGGILLVNKNTPSNIIIKATDSTGVYAEKTITISNGFFEDFENKAIGSKLDIENSYGEIKSDGTKYANFPIVDTGSGSYDAGISLNRADGISENINLDFEFKADVAGNYRLPAILGKDSSGTNQWINESKYTVEDAGSNYIYSFKIQSFADGSTSTDVVKNLTVGKDEWITAIYKINPVSQKFDIILYTQSETVSVQNLGLKTLDNFNISAVRFRANASYARGNYDNISFYSGNKFPRVLSFSGSNIMTVNSDGGKKLLVATLTDNGVENAGHSVRWHVCGVSDDFTGSIGDVRISGANTLIVDGAHNGSVFVVGTLDNNVTTTDIIEIKLNSAFSSVDERGCLTIKGAYGDAYTVNIYNPKGSDFISSCLGYDTNHFVSTTVNVQTNGIGNLDISPYMSADGMYMVEIMNQNNPDDTNVFEVYKNADILTQENRELLFMQDNVSAYLLNFTGANEQLVNEILNIYKSLSTNAKKAALRFSGNSLNDIYASIYLASVLDGNALVKDECKNTLNAMGLKGDIIPMLTSNSEYSRIGSLIIEESLISTALLTEDYLLEYTLPDAMVALLDEIVLTGVRQSSNYPRGVSKYLGLLDNTYYNNADASHKEAIQTAVAGNTYTTISQLNAAVNRVPKPTTSIGGGSGGGGMVPIVNTTGVKPAVSTVVSSEITFKDVIDSHWACDYIIYLAEHGIVTGYDGYYYPENSITRAEYAKLIYSAFDIPDTTMSFFNDVSPELWYYDPINALGAQGIITGYNGNFEPNTYISREDAAVITARALEKYGYSLSNAQIEFLDADKISDYAKSAVSSLVKLNVLTGTPEGNYDPQRNITKAECSAVVFRILNILDGGGK